MRFHLGTELIGAAFYPLLTFAVLAQPVPSAPKDDTARLASVRRILKSVPLIDGHNDLPWQYHKRSNDLAAINLVADNRDLRPALATDIPRLRAGGLGGQF